MPKNELETFCPKNKTDWRTWLKKNHKSKDSVWLVYFRVSTKKASISWSEAVDEAICFGWIDSTKKTIDEERYIQYFSKRKPKSMWSKVNKEKVAKLIKNDLMKKAGLESIEIAKQNGSWVILDEVEALIIPKDLQERLANSKNASEYFNNLSKSNKKLLLYWLVSAKRLETRQKRLLEIVESANKNLKPKQFR